MLVSSSAAALTENETIQIRDSLLPPIQTEINNGVDEVTDFFEEINFTNITEQAVFDAFEFHINNITCANDFVAANGTELEINDALQLTLEKAISNEMDRKNLDQQQWFQNTYVPTTEKLQGCEALKSDLENQVVVTNSKYDNLVLLTNATIEKLQTEKESAEEDATLMFWIAIAIAALFVASNLDWLKQMFKKEY